jgi:hypothetical protein
VSSSISITEAIIRESPNPAATSAVGTATPTGSSSSSGAGTPSSASNSNSNNNNNMNGSNGNSNGIGGSWLFEVNTKTRVFHMRARTQADMMAWIKELKKHTTLEAENDILDEVDIWIEEVEVCHSYRRHSSSVIVYQRRYTHDMVRYGMIDVVSWSEQQRTSDD